MAISEIEENLIGFLHATNVSKEKTIVIIHMLKESEEAMMELGCYMAENEGLTEGEIMKKAVELYQNLPKELQTGE